MKNVAILLRALQLYAHNAHIVSCKGPSFRSDHKMFKTFYEEYTLDYDEVVERMMGLTGAADIQDITRRSCDVCCAVVPADATGAFDALYKAEKALCDALVKENIGATLGTQDLLQKLAGRSEVRQFSLRMRLA